MNFLSRGIAQFWANLFFGAPMLAVTRGIFFRNKIGNYIKTQYYASFVTRKLSQNCRLFFCPPPWQLGWPASPCTCKGLWLHSRMVVFSKRTIFFAMGQTPRPFLESPCPVKIVNTLRKISI
jgi:hypothetical protein